MSLSVISIMFEYFIRNFINDYLIIEILILGPTDLSLPMQLLETKIAVNLLSILQKLTGLFRIIVKVLRREH